MGPLRQRLLLAAASSRWSHQLDVNRGCPARLDMKGEVQRPDEPRTFNPKQGVGVRRRIACSAHLILVAEHHGIPVAQVVCVPRRSDPMRYQSAWANRAAMRGSASARARSSSMDAITGYSPFVRLPVTAGSGPQYSSQRTCRPECQVGPHVSRPPTSYPLYGSSESRICREARRRI
jgi:hypothetical protein